MLVGRYTYLIDYRCAWRILCTQATHKITHVVGPYRIMWVGGWGVVVVVVVLIVLIVLIMIISIHYTHAFKQALAGAACAGTRHCATHAHASMPLQACTLSDCACLFFCEGYILTAVDPRSMLNIR